MSEFRPEEGNFNLGNPRIAVIAARWNAEITDGLLAGAVRALARHNISGDSVEQYRVPGAFELPLMARDLAASGRYGAVACAAFVVDGGIYRHDFVAQAVVDGLMRAGLDTGIPVLSVSLTPHHYQETDHHNAIYQAHFVEKGREAAQAALAISGVRKNVQIAA